MLPGLVRDAPLDIVVLHLQAPLLHGLRHALEFLHAGVVVVEEDPGNVFVSGIYEPGQQLPGAVPVVDDDPGAPQILVKIVIEDHGNLSAVKLLVAVQVGTQDAGLDAVYNKALEILVGHGFQTPALIVKLVVREEDVEVHSVRLEDGANAVNEAGVGAGILALEDQADFQGGFAGIQLLGHDLFPAEIGAAALELVHHTLLDQNIDGPADGLPADLELPAQGVFGRELLIAGKFIFFNIYQQPAVDPLEFLFGRIQSPHILSGNKNSTETVPLSREIPAGPHRARPKERGVIRQ